MTFVRYVGFLAAVACVTFAVPDESVHVVTGSLSASPVIASALNQRFRLAEMLGSLGAMPARRLPNGTPIPIPIWPMTPLLQRVNVRRSSACRPYRRHRERQ